VTALLPLRGAALVAAFFVPRGKGAVTAALSGAFLGAAVFGFAKEPWTDPLGAGVRVLVLLVAGALVLYGVFPPIAAEAAAAAAAFGLPAALLGGLALAGVSTRAAFSGAAVVLASVSIAAAEGCRANADAGWRRGAVAAGGVSLGTLYAALIAPSCGGKSSTAAVAVSLLVGIAAWAPAFAFESRRMRRELSEEVSLGFLPADDAAILALPWKRRLEKRFGRADERREYVRSALLLAVARQQQRRRVGEAVRLRQLEIIAFRTRLRRTLAARASRFTRPESGEFERPKSATRSEVPPSSSGL